MREVQHIFSHKHVIIWHCTYNKYLCDVSTVHHIAMCI